MKIVAGGATELMCGEKVLVVELVADRRPISKVPKYWTMEGVLVVKAKKMGQAPRSRSIVGNSWYSRW